MVRGDIGRLSAGHGHEGLAAAGAFRIAASSPLGSPGTAVMCCIPTAAFVTGSTFAQPDFPRRGDSRWQLGLLMGRTSLTGHPAADSP
jgi:hypothetical protein